ncbi:MAG: MFS transporter [Alphaproteobacteria bacterium]|nr:MFS transporter [Alphaproteobacteria bacterium]
MDLADLNPIYLLMKRLRPGAITADQRRVLWLVGVALLLEAYDVALYALAAPQIQKAFGITEGEVGLVIFYFRLGVIPALVLAYLADVFGRRNMLMVTAAGTTVATLATAFSQDLNQFLIAQTSARVFGYAETMLCYVVIAEEFDERMRGWATGTLGALGAAGTGVAALVFSTVTLLPFGWRALFFLGAGPLLWLLWARRRLPETRRFAQRKVAATYLAPLQNLIRAYPIRLFLVITMTVPLSFASAPAVILTPKFLQSTHGWAPWQVTALILTAGLLALAGALVVGSLSDRIGRRAVLSIAVLVGVPSLASFYTWADGPWLVVFWILTIFADLTAAILIGGMAAELFPTSHRALAAGIRYLASILAGALGFLVEAALYTHTGNHGDAIALMMIPAPLVLLPIWMLPEPAAKSLETVAPEREG